MLSMFTENQLLYPKLQAIYLPEVMSYLWGGKVQPGGFSEFSILLPALGKNSAVKVKRKRDSEVLILGMQLIGGGGNIMLKVACAND